jgi:hypothetical protein
MSRHMSDVLQWTASEDAVPVEAEYNGRERGDGYDVEVYRSRATGRYLVIVGRPGWAEHVYVATSLAGAQGCIRHGYTPGSGPGAYRYVRDARRLREVRAGR